MREFAYEQIISAARARLDDTGTRIADAPHPFHATWWPSQPTFEQQLASDFGTPTLVPEIEDAFRADVEVIRELLVDSGHIPDLASWQAGGATGAARDMWTSLNLCAEALDIWDKTAVPVRRHGDLILRVFTPQDVMGSPVIQAMHVDEYVASVAAKTADDQVALVALKRRVQTWRRVAVVLGLVVVLLLLALVA